MSSRMANRPGQSTMGEDALEIWDRKFQGNRLVRLTRNDAEPFKPGRHLGGGGIGIVNETTLEGISLALKRTYTQRLTDYHMNEVKILSSITEKRHKHVVQLIGSYIHRQKGGYEVGLLIWPVAHCDLAVYLRDIDLLGQWIEAPGTRTEDSDVAMENLSVITDVRYQFVLGDEHHLELSATHLFAKALTKLQSIFGCVANAVSWIHQQGIRHKDLKPSQILLSSGGLWLTDFGWSRDISEMTQSVTSGGENTTAKYQAPERAQKQQCGRSEDVFSLGCTFVEMAYQLARPRIPPGNRSMPWKQRGWLFQENLEEIGTLLTVLKDPLDTMGYGRRLTDVIQNMLAFNPEDRPSVDEVIESLSYGDFFGGCCPPKFKAENSPNLFMDTEDNSTKASKSFQSKHSEIDACSQLELDRWVTNKNPDSEIYDTGQNWMSRTKDIKDNELGSRFMNSPSFFSHTYGRSDTLAYSNHRRRPRSLPSNGKIHNMPQNQGSGADADSEDSDFEAPVRSRTSRRQFNPRINGAFTARPPKLDAPMPQKGKGAEAQESATVGAYRKERVEKLEKERTETASMSQSTEPDVRTHKLRKCVPEIGQIFAAHQCANLETEQVNGRISTAYPLAENVNQATTTHILQMGFADSTPIRHHNGANWPASTMPTSILKTPIRPKAHTIPTGKPWSANFESKSTLIDKNAQDSQHQSKWQPSIRTLGELNYLGRENVQESRGLGIAQLTASKNLFRSDMNGVLVLACLYKFLNIHRLGLDVIILTNRFNRVLFKTFPNKCA